VRMGAARALTAIGDKKSISYLESATRDENEFVRKIAGAVIRREEESHSGNRRKTQTFLPVPDVSRFVSKSELWAIVYKTSFSILPLPKDEIPVFVKGRGSPGVLMYGTRKTIFVTETSV
jgi:hypothetical protein